MDNLFTEEEIAFLTLCVEGGKSNDQVLEKVDSTSSLEQPNMWPDATFQQSNSNIYPGNDFLHRTSTLPGPSHSLSYRVNGPTFGEHKRVSEQPIAISQNVSRPTLLSTCVSERATGVTSGYCYTNFLPSGSITGPSQSPSGTILPSTRFYQNTMGVTSRYSSNRPLPSGSITGPSHSPSSRVNKPTFGEQQRMSQQPIAISQDVSRPILPSTCVSKRGTGVTSGCFYTNFLPSRSISRPSQSASGTILPSTNFNQNTMGGTSSYSSIKPLPSGAITCEMNLLGSRSTPIEISDSPIRESTTVQYKRSWSSQRQKRARESESEVEIMHSNILDSKKKAKNQYENESNLYSIKSNTKWQAKRDGAEHVDGHNILPIGQELLSTSLSRNETELPSFQNPGVAGLDFISSMQRDYNRLF